MRSYPKSRRDTAVDTIHGVQVTDPFRWLEDGSSPEVKAWEERQWALVREALEPIPQRQVLTRQLSRLWRYDDRTPPRPCLRSERVFYQRKRADEDKWFLCFRPSLEAPEEILIDPNTWAPTETLEFFAPSPDGRYLAFGRAQAGDEDAELHLMDVDSRALLPDRFGGRQKGAVQWRHDNSGLFFSAKPRPGEVPEGEHHYWHRVVYHPLGSGPEGETIVLDDPEVKERYHWAQVSEDGRYNLLYRAEFDRMQVFLQDLEAGGDPRPLVDAPDTNHFCEIVGGRLFILTAWGAPRRRLMVADLSAPERPHWRPCVPEHPEDTLFDISAIGGRLYLSYKHRATTRIEVFDLEGTHLKSLDLPGLGTASVWGRFGRPEVWVSFVSFDRPRSVYTWDFESNALTLFQRTPIDLDVSDLSVEQVVYPSRDGTEISMFIVHRRGAPRDGRAPFILTGYGGFNVSKTPAFSVPYALWVKAGGGVAIPNLRGGGEYGQGWHEAGMRERKQNVFDDFIAAAEYLIAEGWTSPAHLGAMGGSNGGLLIGAAVTQRPDLFKAVLCQVPLLDMVRYHLFGFANIWALEYGSSEDADLFPHLLAYSPYHRVESGVAYPAMFITGSENDARTDPLHARKFGAAVQEATTGEGPILLAIERDSGHHGAVTLKERVRQTADYYGFLMDQLDLPAPILPEPSPPTSPDLP